MKKKLNGGKRPKTTIELTEIKKKCKQSIPKRFCTRKLGKVFNECFLENLYGGN